MTSRSEPTLAYDRDLETGSVRFGLELSRLLGTRQNHSVSIFQLTPTSLLQERPYRERRLGNRHASTVLLTNDLSTTASVQRKVDRRQFPGEELGCWQTTPTADRESGIRSLLRQPTAVRQITVKTPAPRLFCVCIGANARATARVVRLPLPARHQKRRTRAILQRTSALPVLIASAFVLRRSLRRRRRSQRHCAHCPNSVGALGTLNVVPESFSPVQCRRLRQGELSLLDPDSVPVVTQSRCRSAAEVVSAGVTRRDVSP